MSFFDDALGFAADFGNSSFMKTLSSWAPIINAGANIAGAWMNYSAQKDAYNQQTSAINESMRQNQAALNERMMENQVATNESIGQRARAAAIEKAKMAAIQNESGASGNSQARLRNAVLAQSGMDIATLQSNNDSFARQVAREIAREEAKASSAKSSLGGKPSWLTPALSTLGSVGQLGFSYRNPRRPSGLSTTGF